MREKFNSKLLLWTGLILCMVLLLFTAFFWKPWKTDSESGPTKEDSVATSEREGLSETELEDFPPALLPEDEDAMNTDLEFEQRLGEFVQEVGRLQDEPENTEESLDRFAEGLKIEELEILARKAGSFHLEGDERALAVYLLNLNGTATSIRLLADYISAPWPKDMNPRQEDQERILRAMAVEGLAHPHEAELALRTIQDLNSKVSDSLIVDRLARTKAFLEGKAPRPQNQDLDALERLISSPDDEN